MEVIINGQTITGDEKEIRKALRQAKKEEEKKRQEDDAKYESSRQLCNDRYVYLCDKMDTSEDNWEFPRGWKLKNPNPAKHPTYLHSYQEYSICGCHGMGDFYFYRSSKVEVLEFGNGEPCAFRVTMMEHENQKESDRIQWFACAVFEDKVTMHRLPSFVSSVLESHATREEN